MGEGKKPLVALVRTPESGADWATVLGIAFRRNRKVTKRPRQLLWCRPAGVVPTAAPLPPNGPSGDEELQKLNKRLKVGQVQRAVRLLQANDIVCQGLLILGTPSDGGRSIQHSD